MEPEEVASKIQTRFRRTVDGTPDFHSALLLVHSEGRNVHLSLAAGQVSQSPIDPAQPFFSASIGKTFTATIIAMVAEDDELRFDDPISPYLSDEVLSGLHIYRGTDHTDDIQIHHLLTHTSGLPHQLSDEFGECAEGTTRVDDSTTGPVVGSLSFSGRDEAESRHRRRILVVSVSSGVR